MTRIALVLIASWFTLSGAIAAIMAMASSSDDKMHELFEEEQDE